MSTSVRSRASSSSSGGAVEGPPGFSRAKTVMALTVVVGCFAILWPKIFYPMLTASLPGVGVIGGGSASAGGGKDGGGLGLRHPREEAYMHQERPLHSIDAGTLHPALREKGSAIPQPGLGAGAPRRTLDIEARPGPQPGVRPPMGHGAHYVPTRERSGPSGGTMGIIMPLYTIGIVVFFLYTIFKILFRKPISESPSPAAAEQTKPRKASEFGSGPDSRDGPSTQQQQQRSTGPRGESNHDVGGRRTSSEEYYGGRRRSSAGLAPIPSMVVVQDISQPRQMAMHQRAAPKPSPVRELNGEGPEGNREQDARDVEIDMLRKRLAETEAAMERIVGHIGTAAGRLSPSLVAVVGNVEKEDFLGSAADKENRKPEKLFVDTVAFNRFVHDLSALILSQSLTTASAALVFEAAAAGKKSAKGAPNKSQVVLGMVERAGMEGGDKWPPSSPTPSLSPRVLTPPLAHEPPVRNIYLEGPIPPESDQLMVSAETSEPEPYDSDEEEELNKPVVLSGKVTLSMFSSAASTATGGGGYGGDELTEATTSMELDGLPRLTAARGGPDLSDALANAINDENGVRAAGNTHASSPDMEEYEVVKADEEEDTQYATAEADGHLQANWADETAADISAIDGGGVEEEEEEEYEEEEEELEGDDEEDEEEEEDEEPPAPAQSRSTGGQPHNSSAQQGGHSTRSGGGGGGLRLGGSFDSVQSQSQWSSSGQSSGGRQSASTTASSSGSRSPTYASPNGTYFSEP